ncbi:MAG: DNAase [Candidatus Dactylopiibacterium carminicum]|uniref:DNAase n=1 Tax=Candidatus Dactylopiibacterium carminicum TaxID=857335 RepID=A0A272ETJ9_9RHOO|nr:TatD family hydrolase [Candidatus Dactylopiibacterium carminicum]KAF7599425.1 TatD family deoxyribonuclease [Candidatus Dactylopiibacterium carminicum]PAS93417.1 MAG: DNAase [Candidatus Dactylopiibacterium carminicum]PAS95936.1 MAG: DNAase [Candidatus Dactylopiibacterium carminicum]PAS99433.1 MAG: DNAase [Candidatus Dactylopiibacterium carminicum]
MWFDTHLHLDAPEFETDRAAVIAAARAAGVEAALLLGVERANWACLPAMREAWPGCWIAYGIHPLYVARAQESDIEALRAQLAAGEAVAIGEIGLDGYIADPDWERQEWFFAAQLKLAREFDLPVVLHIRRAQDRVLKYLRRHRVRGGFAHAFNGSRQQADAFIGLGFKLGFGGAMTYSGSTRIRALATTLPLDALVLESDGPDIPPAWAPDRRNDPANVARFAEVLAGLRGIPPIELAVACEANVKHILGA